MKNVLASQLMESLMDIGLDVNIAEKYFTGFDHAIFTPTSSRRVLGVMNDQKQQLLFMMTDYYDHPLSHKEITKRLNQTPYKIPEQKNKYGYTAETFAEKLGGTINEV